MSEERVRAYYRTFDEWARLDAPAGRVELARALRILDRTLAPGSRVLDLGGGPGRYAIELGRRGHRVTLVDISPEQLDVAKARIREHGVEDLVDRVLCASATDLHELPDASFDAVVAFGPFYHLVDAADRRRAAREATRIVQPQGLLLVMFLPRLSGVAGLAQRAAADPEQVPAGGLRRAFRDGVFENAVGRGFQAGWFARPEEIVELFVEPGVDRVDVVSLRGITAEREAAYLELGRATPALQRELDAILDETAGDPAVVQLGGHAVFVGRKRA